METAFPEFMQIPDPLLEQDHTRDNRIDPRLASEVLPFAADLASDRFRAESNEAGRRPPVDGPASMRYVESSFKWSAAEVGAKILLGYSTYFELARFFVPPGCFGVIDHIDTHFGLSIPVDEDLPVRVCPTEISFDRPEQPYLIESLYSLKYGGWNVATGVRWLLRLVSKRAQDPGAPQTAFRYQGMSGQTFPDLAEWYDQRFAWGRTREPLRLLVPEDHTVELWVGSRSDALAVTEETLSLDSVEILGTHTFKNILNQLGSPLANMDLTIAIGYERANLVNVAGRLIGTVQPYRDNPAALANSTRGLS